MCGLKISEPRSNSPKINTPEPYFGIYTSIPGCRYITTTLSKRHGLEMNGHKMKLIHIVQKRR